MDPIKYVENLNKPLTSEDRTYINKSLTLSLIFLVILPFSTMYISYKTTGMNGLRSLMLFLVILIGVVMASALIINNINKAKTQQ